MNIGIIGGGASGIMAAVTAARNGVQVTLLEKNDRIGKKILVTGNGKCNFPNLSFCDSCYYTHHSERMEKVLRQFPPEETVRFFEGLGMRVLQKNGFLYPASQQASTVLDVLRLALEEAGVKVICGASAVSAVFKEDGFFVCCTDGTEFRFDRLILSCGGKASPKTGSDGGGYKLAKQLGHSLYPVAPALTALRCGGDFWKGLSGVRCDARMTLLVDEQEAGTERGELQVTDYGISGVAVFQLSRIASYALAEKKQVKMRLDLLPEQTEEQLLEESRRRYEKYAHREADAFFTGTAHKKWMQYFRKTHGFGAQERIEDRREEDVEAVFLHMKHFSVTVTGTQPFEYAQVSAGGVKLSEVDDTLQSVLTPGLYLTGELLDVDGKCGGYNLQWAWSSGYTAGRAIARRWV